MESGIKNLMFDFTFFRLCRERFRFLDADRADENRLSATPAIGDQINHCFITFTAGTIDLVIMINTLHLAVCRN